MKPEHVIRFGYISATIFVNEVETESGRKPIRAVKLERRYKDAEGGWKTASTLGLVDLPVAIEVLTRALAHVASMEAECDKSSESPA